MKITMRKSSLAECLDISQDAVDRLIALGQLPEPIQLDQYEVWRAEDVEAYLRAHAAKPAYRKKLYEQAAQTG